MEVLSEWIRRNLRRNGRLLKINLTEKRKDFLMNFHQVSPLVQMLYRSTLLLLPVLFLKSQLQPKPKDRKCSSKYLFSQKSLRGTQTVQSKRPSKAHDSSNRSGLNHTDAVEAGGVDGSSRLGQLQAKDGAEKLIKQAGPSIFTRITSGPRAQSAYGGMRSVPAAAVER